tara:strand:+ start:349 stop:1035 length:687 start_codon:yes stop_codon:yes gene_type:complete
MPYIRYDDRIEISPEVPCQGALIWLHGLGANGDDFVPIAARLQLPQLRFIFPHAPERPITINRGWVMRAWYDIKTLEESPNRECIEGVEQSHRAITDLIDSQVREGLSPNQIVLAGFSQGGAMALHTGLRYPGSLGGLMALSTYLVASDNFIHESHPANATTPILFCHGKEDGVVSLERGRHAHDTIAKHSPERDLQWHEFEMSHEVCNDEIKVVQSWLQNRFEIEPQ